MTIYSDYDNYFTGTPTATQTPFGGGSLFKNNADTATFTDPTGKKTVIGQGSNLQDLYNTNPYLRDAWGSNSNYDLSAWNNAANAADSELSISNLPPGTTTDPFTGNLTGNQAEIFKATNAPEPDNSFTLPTDVFSSSGSSGNSLNLSNNQSQSQSGINWENPLNKSILQSLINSGNNLQGYTDQLGSDLTAKYNNQMRRAMDPSNFQGLLNSLSNRRMINSDVAGDAFGTAGANIAKSIADKAFDAQVLQSQAQMNVPTILAQLANLGQESSASSSGSGLGVSTNESYASDPFEPYRAMADLMMFQPTV